MTTQFSVPVSALSVSETLPFTALTYATRTTLKALPEQSNVPDELYAEAERLRLTPTGPLQYIYTGVNGDEINEFQLEAV